LIHVLIAALYLIVLISTGAALMLIERKDLRDLGADRDPRGEE
jgi:hypothetical protein